jgi:hypothetical protein
MATIIILNPTVGFGVMLNRVKLDSKEFYTKIWIWPCFDRITKLNHINEVWWPCPSLQVFILINFFPRFHQSTLSLLEIGLCNFVFIFLLSYLSLMTRVDSYRFFFFQFILSYWVGYGFFFFCIYIYINIGLKSKQ